MKIFDVRFDLTQQKFEDMEVQEFLQGYDKQITNIRSDFFIINNIPHYSIVIMYEEISLAKSQCEIAKSSAKKHVALKVESKQLYEKLRKWRNEKSQRQSVPAYVFLTNQQMAEIANLRPVTKVALGKIAGIGKIKLEKYANDIINIIKNHMKD